MATEKMQPTAQVTLVLGKTLTTNKRKFTKGKPVTVTGEAAIRSFETDGRFVVRRSSEIRKEVLEQRKTTKKVKAEAGDAENKDGKK